MKKTLLIPVAALALTATGAQAFSTEALENIGLSDSQVMAFEEARELKRAGEKSAARDILINAGIDEDTLKSVRRAIHEERHQKRSAIKEAVSSNDYDEFLEVAEDTHLLEAIDNETEFERLVEAFALREAGDREGARVIMNELGIEHKLKDGQKGKRGKHSGFFHRSES